MIDVRYRRDTYEFLKVRCKPLRNPLQNQPAHIYASCTNVYKRVQMGSNGIKWKQIGYNGNSRLDARRSTRLLFFNTPPQASASQAKGEEHYDLSDREV